LKLRAARIAGMSAALAALAAVGLWLSLPKLKVPPAPPPFPTRPATQTEQIALISAILDHARAEMAEAATAATERAGGSDPMWLLHDSAVLFCPGQSALPLRKNCAVSGQLTAGILSPDFNLDYDARPPLPLAFRSALIEANRMPRRMPALPAPSVAPIPNSAMPSASLADWQRFFAAYPHRPDILRVSWAVLPRAGGEALIYTERYCGPLCADGALYRLRSVDGHWVVGDAFRLWIS
jgi:hypothetical protein